MQLGRALGAISLCWDILITVWLVTAFRTKPTLQRESLKDSFWYRFLLLAGFLWLFFGAYVPILDIVLIHHTAKTTYIGLAFAVAGLALALWARATLGRNWSADVTFKQDHELIQTGPYAYVRHPIYSALLLMLIGTALAAGYLGAVFAVPLAFASFWIKLRQEEQVMLEHFKTKYTDYKKRVGALIPHLP